MALPSNFFATQSVLVVDDIDTIRNAVKGMLQMFGCRDVALASNGDRALELCELKAFDFILCDFNLGKGKDGYQLFEELKLRFLLKTNAVFILISAEMTQQVVHGLVELQPDDYLLKPFSYKTLETRLVRALEKRIALGGIYDALANKDYTKALSECAKASKESNKYTLMVTRLKGEVLLHLQHPQLALDLYDVILQHRDFSWARLGKAIAYYHLNDYSRAEKLLYALCDLNETRIEALNWLSSIYAQRQRFADAKKLLVESLKLSPKNISRQRALANIALLEGDNETAARCFKVILSNSHFSVHEHIVNSFNYIHCLLDQAKTGNELQQAKTFSQVQVILKNASQRFDKKQFCELEKIAAARMRIVKGALKEAYRLLNDCDIDVIVESGRDTVLALAKTWLELGEHRKHHEIMALISLPEESNNIEVMSYLLLINKSKKESNELIRKLLELNEKGINLYRNGLYPAATATFLDAHKIMPNNIQLSLNLAQSLVKGWPTNEPFSLKKNIAKQCVNVIEAAELDEVSMQRYRCFESALKAL
ncbi:response regulator [Psychromonas sp. MME2]|uniref:response regulator n=1 Tax=unclassified Psychromonas TaxID=2614957 RepID=UPI00339CFB79